MIHTCALVLNLPTPTPMDFWHFTFALFVFLASLAKSSNAIIKQMLLITEAERNLPGYVCVGFFFFFPGRFP